MSLTNMPWEDLLKSQSQFYVPQVSGGSIYVNKGVLAMTGKDLNEFITKTPTNGKLKQVGSGWFDFTGFEIRNDKTYFIMYQGVPDAGHEFFIAKDGNWVGMDARRTRVKISSEIPEKLDGLWCYGDAEFLKWSETQKEADTVKAAIRKANPGEGYVALKVGDDGKLIGTWMPRTLGL